MAPNQPTESNSGGSARDQANARHHVGYSPRQTRTVPRRTIDGLVTSGRVLIPASQEEYITSLSESQPRLSRHIMPSPSRGSSHIFGSKLREFKTDKDRIRRSLPGLALLLVMIVSISGLAGLRSGKSAEAELWGTRSSIEPAGDESSEISERRPSNMQSYQVAEDLPRFLRIKDMGLSSRVRRVGVGTKTELKLPSNIHDVGWYESSVKPGESGAVVLTGHSSGPTKPGIFHDLTELEPGDELEVETGAGETYSYYVVKLEAFDIDDPLDPLLVSAVPGSPALNLITEIGRFDSNANTFDQRLVVYAVQKVMPSTTSSRGASDNNTR
jgi:LPXTG-site transpeptidase (sortase) family protein